MWNVCHHGKHELVLVGLEEAMELLPVRSIYLHTDDSAIWLDSTADTRLSDKVTEIPSVMKQLLTTIKHNWGTAISILLLGAFLPTVVLLCPRGAGWMRGKVCTRIYIYSRGRHMQSYTSKERRPEKALR